MEEDIKILNDYLDENDKKFVKPKRLKFLQAIENLINKNKELEKIIASYENGEMLSNKQAELIQNAIKEEMNTYKKELDKNYIPRILLEEELKIIKQEKEKGLNDIRKNIFCEGIIFELEDLLNFGKAKGE